MQHRNRPSVVPGRYLAKITGSIVFGEVLWLQRNYRTHFVPRLRGGILEKCSAGASFRQMLGQRKSDLT